MAVCEFAYVGMCDFLGFCDVRDTVTASHSPNTIHYKDRDNYIEIRVDVSLKSVCLSLQSNHQEAFILMTTSNYDAVVCELERLMLSDPECHSFIVPGSFGWTERRISNPE